MIAFDMEGNWQNFYLEGEWAQFKMDRQCGAISATGNPLCSNTTAVIDHPTFSGFTLGAAWMITGETKTYTPAAINETQGGLRRAGAFAALLAERRQLGRLGSWWLAIATPT